MALRVLTLVLLALAPPALAQNSFASDRVTTEYYDVSGVTLSDVEAAMNANGPNGYWAHTETRWRWTAECDMSFAAHVVLPRLVGIDRLSSSERKEFQRMLSALTAHELDHVQIGRDWAQAIADADCPANTNAIDATFGVLDAALDARTNHGVATGATLNY